MKASNYYRRFRFLLFIGLLFFFISVAKNSSADLYINILAVNGADVAQDKEINHVLPKELAKEDVVDTDGLELKYDVDAGAYSVTGVVKLGAKDTKTYKVRVRDVWKVDENEIVQIQEEIDKNLARIKDTEFFPTGQIKRESLIERLDFIVKQQEKFADNIEKRIGRYRIYEKELSEIRTNALSVKYWKSRPPTPDEADIFTYIIELENPNDEEEAILSPKHYVPKEVKPEHFVELQGFEVKYDALKGRSYLQKEDKLKAQQKKRYEIGIIDIWKIRDYEIEELRDRTANAFELLRGSEFLDSAEYLAQVITKNLDYLVESQKIDRSINDHIAAYRKNKIIYDKTVEDVEALERLLEALREDLERSKVKKVLEKISEQANLASIVKTIFKKPDINTAWKIILGVVIFVGIYTLIHFTIWGIRSKNAKIEETQKPASSDTPEEDKE